MTTRAATFSAKIRNLTDYYQRAHHHHQPPSGLEVANTLRYFQQTLIGFLKDVQNNGSSVDAFRYQNSDTQRSALFPNLNYSGLYYAISNLIDAYPEFNSGQTALGHALLSTLKNVYLFLDRDTLDQLPMNLALMLTTFPKDLHADVMHLLTDVILPFTLYAEENETYATESIPAVMMFVFQYTQEPSHHTCLMETLMSLKRDVHKDLVAVIASGTSESRIPAANLLFHYWPLLNPQVLDRKPVTYKPHAWAPTRCQHRDCTSGGSSQQILTHSPLVASGSSIPKSGSGGSNQLATLTGEFPGFLGDRRPTATALGSLTAGGWPSVKKCYDPLICAEVADTSPPITVCKFCAENISDRYKVSLTFMLQAMPTVINVCQNRGCQSSSRLAVATCFSEDCIRAHHHVPIRLCEECNEAFHGEATEGTQHMVHTRLESPWGQDRRTFHYTVEAIVKLLKETSYMLDTMDQEKRPKWLQQLEGKEVISNAVGDERRMLSRYGIWLLAGLCSPTQQTPKYAVGHLMSMVFQWFATTALLPNDATGAALEQLKTDFVCDWLNSVLRIHYDVFVEVLMPRPPEYGRVGGLWDKLTTRTEQIKEGLSKILALIPYDIISFDTWDKIMPEWLEAICNEVPEKDLGELKILLCKIFEVDMCPLPFPPEQIYSFLRRRLETGTWFEQQQALDWLQILSDMDIVIPLEILLSFCTSASKRMAEMHVQSTTTASAHIQQEKEPRREVPPKIRTTDSIGDYEGLLDDDITRPMSPLTPEGSPMRRRGSTAQIHYSVFDTDGTEESNAGFFASMVDIVLRQIEMSDIEENQWTDSEDTQKILLAINDLLKSPWHGSHVCHLPEYDEFVDCVFCQETTIFYEILMDLAQRLCPKEEVRIEMPPEIDYNWDEPEPIDDTDISAVGTTPTSFEMSKHMSVEQLAAAGIRPHLGLGGLPVIMTAMEQEAPDQVEFVSLLQTEEMETAMAQAVTLTETDVGMATCKVVTATLVDEHDQKIQGTPISGLGPETWNFWNTSLGKFRFTLDELPAQLQMIYWLLIDIEKHPDPDAIYFLLHSLKYLCLHGEALNLAHKQHRGFLIWAQENLLIPKFWNLLRAEYSQIAHISVPLILHCLTLPSGADMFWKAVNDAFTSEDWTVRFSAVEKVTLIAQFLDPMPVRGNLVLQGALANAFAFLIAGVQDPNCSVSQRAILHIETIRTSSLKCLCSCLEAQFDAVIVDRPLIIHRLSLLTCLLPELPILSWDFFVQRFDVLTMEAQIKLEQAGEIAMAQDLMHTDPMSDIYSRKVSKAKTALDQNESVRSIVRSLDKAMKYQTTISMKMKSKMATTPDRDAGSSKASHRHSGGSALDPEYNLGKLKEFTDEESNFCLMLNKAMDLESAERHTTYLIIELFMKFLSASAFNNPDEKAAAKKQSIVLRHLNILLGYNNTEKSFTIPPQKLRSSAICNAFLSGLPKVLDSNLFIGNQIMPIASLFLQYFPSPQRYASDFQPPNYSLWYLEPQTRHSWLWSLLLILYKYRFDQPPINDTVLNLIKLIINTLDAQAHKCEAVESVYRTPLFQSRDSSITSDSDEAVEYGENGVVSRGRVVSGISAAECYERRKATRRKPQRKPTFDEKEEAILEENEEGGPGGIITVEDRGEWGVATEFQPIMAQVTVERGMIEPIGLASDSEIFPPATKVDSRIMQQINEFDRSFTSPEPESPEGAMVRPDMLQVTSALQPSVHVVQPMVESPAEGFHMATAAHVIEPNVVIMGSGEEQKSNKTQIHGPIEMKSMIMEPKIVQDEKPRQISSHQVHSMDSQLVSMESQLIQPAQSTVLEAIGEEADETPPIRMKPPTTSTLKPVLSKSSDERKTGLKAMVEKLPDRPTPTLQKEDSKDSGVRYSAPRPCIGSMRYAESTVVMRCTQCNIPLENYDEDTIALSIVCLSTFVHREPGMASPYLKKMLETVSRIAHLVTYPWQNESSVFVPGNSRSVAKQFLRVVLYQMSSNRLFLQLFLSNIPDPNFFHTMSFALNDFAEMSPVSVLQHLLDDVAADPPTSYSQILTNVADYITHVPLDSCSQTWVTVIGQFSAFFTKYGAEEPNYDVDNDAIFVIFGQIMKVNNIASFKTVNGFLDSTSKILGQSLSQTAIKLTDLLLLSTLCNRAFTKEREKLTYSRSCVNELLQATKFKVNLPEDNYLTLINFILEDAGEPITEELEEHMVHNTGAADCARPFVQDFVDFIADLHVLTKFKTMLGGMSLRGDTLGGDLKAGLAQFVAAEIGRCNSRDPRTVLRYLPWLFTTPSITSQGPAEFAECVEHSNQLSWILLGALQSNSINTSLPIPIDVSHHIADQIQFILAGFAEQSKDSSVVHMSALFHAFHLCQLWTIYCEKVAETNPDSDTGLQASANVMDFWSRVTPAILQLLSHSKVLADMVNLHFLNTIEALLECESAVTAKLYSVWQPILSAYHTHDSKTKINQVIVRLSACENQIPGKEIETAEKTKINPWLKRVRFKISQIELQSSNVQSKFYSV